MKSIVLQVLMFISNTQHILQANQYQRLATASSIKLTEWCNDIPIDLTTDAPCQRLGVFRSPVFSHWSVSGLYLNTSDNLLMLSQPPEYTQHIVIDYIVHCTLFLFTYD